MSRDTPRAPRTRYVPGERPPLRWTDTAGVTWRMLDVVRHWGDDHAIDDAARRRQMQGAFWNADRVFAEADA